MDVQKEINTRLDAYIKSEKFEEKMQGIVEKSVNDAVESLFSYGEVRDAIKAMFKEKIAINVDQMDFVAVNQIVTDLVKQKTHAAFSEPLRTKLAAELDDMFAPAPAEVTVQGIVDLLREEHREDGCGCADPEKDMTVAIEKASYGITLKIWADERYTKTYSGDKRENDPDVHLYAREDGRIAILYNQDIRRTLGTAIYGFDAKLFMMYCAGTIITDLATVDPDDLNLRINDHLDY